MRSKVLLPVFVLAEGVTARIVGLAAPAYIAPSSNVSVTLVTENYIQTVADISVAFALSPQTYPGVLGVELLGSFYLGPSQSNVLTNLTFSVPVPPSIDNIQYLTGVVTSLYGASHSVVSTIYYVPVEPANETSSEQNAVYTGLNACSTSTVGDTATSSVAPGPTSTSTTSSSSPTCYVDAGYGEVQSLIQQSQQAVLILLNDVVQESNSTSQADLAKLESLTNEVYKTVTSNATACATPGPSTWPPLSPADSKIRAQQMLQQIQAGLQALSSAALESDCARGISITCQLLQLVSDVESYPGF